MAGWAELTDEGRVPAFTHRAMREARDNLEALWEFAAEQSRPYGHVGGC